MERRKFIKRALFIPVAGVALVQTGCFKIEDEVTYTVITSSCNGCGDCLKACSHSAISIANNKASISYKTCSGCGKCVRYCKSNAIKVA